MTMATNDKMKTVSRYFDGSRMPALMAKLLDASQWFQAEPHPEDVWEVTMKQENEALLTTLWQLQ